MKKYIYPILLSGLCLSLSSCGGKKAQEEKLEVIPLEAAFTNPQQIKTSDCFKKVRYVALETNDSCLVSAGAYVSIMNDKIVVRSGRDRCQLFDKATGRFLCSAGHVGEDPEGYSSVSGGFENPNSNQLVFPGFDGGLVSYDAEGQFLRKWKPAVPSGNFPAMAAFCYYGKDMLVGHYSATDSLPARVIFFRGDEVVRTDEMQKEARGEGVVTPDEIADIAVLKDGGSGLLVIGYKNGKKAAYSMGNCFFWHNGDEMFFKESYNDTIYRASAEKGLEPVRLLNFGIYDWPFDQRFEAKKDAIYPTGFMENDDVILLRFMVNILGNVDQTKTYNAVYRKADGSVKVSLYDDKITDDLNGFLPVQPLSVSAKGEFAGLLSAEEIGGWFEEHGDAAELPESVKALKSVHEEDNPVVVIMESGQ